MSTVFAVIIIIGIVIAAVAVGIYYANKNKGPVGQFSEILNFYNGLQIDGRPVSIYLTALRGTVGDTGGWTNWEKTPNTMTGSSSKMVPLPDGLKKAFKINYGEYGHVAIGTRGYPGINYVARPNCDDEGGPWGPATFICERGDSYIDPYIDLDPPLVPNGPQALKRGTEVQFKPDIDTKMEFTFGCTEVDKTLCAVNPSCINVPTTCIYVENNVTKNMNDFMNAVRAVDSGAIFKEDLLLHASNGDIIPLPDGLHLTSETNFDISNVDGFTHQADVIAIRPTITDNDVKCLINSVVIDNLTTLAPQVLIDTSTISLQVESACPSNEILWPPKRIIAPDDKHHPVFGSVFPFTPAGTTVKGIGYKDVSNPFTAAFAEGDASAVDLKIYRYPGRALEEAVALKYGYMNSPYLGCASPCKILTDGSNTAQTQMHPVPGGRTWARLSYLEPPSVPPTFPIPNPSASIQGIREVCCTPDGLTDAGNPNANTFTRCNTSGLWHLDNGTTPVGNYGFSFYVNNYDPRPSDVWYPAPGNPYLDLSKGSKYVNAVNNNKLSSQGPRAYAWQHDDAYKLVQCNVASTGNEVTITNASGGTRKVYGQYKVLVTIGSRPAGL